ncbi:hypothetical protein T492DRAFT_901004, partial [Pavlovales sp. CCMP2436]
GGRITRAAQPHYAQHATVEPLAPAEAQVFYHLFNREREGETQHAPVEPLTPPATQVLIQSLFEHLERE